MSASVRGMTWHFWGRHRWGLAAVGIYALGLALLLALLPASLLKDDRHALNGVMLSIPLVIGLIYVAAVFCFGFECQLEAAASGFPSWMFTLPVPTRIIVGWAMLQGVAAVTALGLVWVHLILPPLGWTFPVWIPVLLAAMVVLLQALLWTPFPLPWARVAALLLALASLTFLSPAFEQVHGMSPTVFLGIALCLLPIAYFVAVAGVTRARHGEGGTWSWTGAASSQTDALCDRPFSSPERAQLWYQWRRSGLTFPMFAGLHSAGAMLLILTQDPAGLGRQGLAFLTLPMFFIALGASSPGLGGGTRDPFPLNPFLATRPQSTPSLVAACLKSAALSNLAGWALLLPTIVVWGWKIGTFGMLGTWWEQQTAMGNALQAAVLLLLALIAPVALTLNAMLGNILIAMTGRRWVVYGSALVPAVVAIGGLYFASWLVQHPERLTGIVDTLPPYLVGAALLKLLISGLAIRALVRSQLLPARTLLWLLGLWLLILACLTGLFAWINPNGLTLLLVLGTILALPLARLTLMPLALAWNRHR